MADRDDLRSDVYLRLTEGLDIADVAVYRGFDNLTQRFWWSLTIITMAGTKKTTGFFIDLADFHRMKNPEVEIMEIARNIIKEALSHG